MKIAGCLLCMPNQTTLEHLVVAGMDCVWFWGGLDWETDGLWQQMILNWRSTDGDPFPSLELSPEAPWT